MLLGHRVRLIDAFRVFDANNSRRLGLASKPRSITRTCVNLSSLPLRLLTICCRRCLHRLGFEKMLLSFDPTKKTINVDDVRMAFRQIERKSAAGTKGSKTSSEQPGTVGLDAVREFFGSDC
jgi:hypothetical protein